jgi:hypothetical protein
VGVSRGVSSIAVDDVQVDAVTLVDDSRPHRIRVILGQKPI